MHYVSVNTAPTEINKFIVDYLVINIDVVIATETTSQNVRKYQLQVVDCGFLLMPVESECVYNHCLRHLTCTEFRGNTVAGMLGEVCQ